MNIVQSVDGGIGPERVPFGTRHFVARDAASNCPLLLPRIGSSLHRHEADAPQPHFAPGFALRREFEVAFSRCSERGGAKTDEPVRDDRMLF